MSSQQALETHNLTIGYRHSRRSDIVIAENLNLNLKRGELTGLLGPNGAGKSTLLRTLAGMQPALLGNTLLANTDMSQLSAHELATHLSIVLTERPNLGLMNGYALVALGRHPYTNWSGQLSQYDEAMVRWAVDAVQAGDIADKPVNELSDGQRQKLMIARALAQETDVIILDEPTAYLDLPRRVEMMQLLKYLAIETHRAILLSTHDLDLALRNCDTLWLMSEGEVRVGTPEDLVLNSAFEATFHSEGLTFDKRTGTFSIATHHHTPITVTGEGIPYIWTRRALERQNYKVVETRTSIHIDIQTDGDDTVWHLMLNDTKTSYSSIQKLLNTLRQKQIKES